MACRALEKKLAYEERVVLRRDLAQPFEISPSRRISVLSKAGTAVRISNNSIMCRRFQRGHCLMARRDHECTRTADDKQGSADHLKQSSTPPDREHASPVSLSVSFRPVLPLAVATLLRRRFGVH